MLALICLIATGCGQGAAASGVPPEEARPSAASVPGAASTPVGGGTAAQRALLRQILRGMGPTSISEIRIVPAPRGSGYRLDPGAVELDMDLRGKEGGLHAEWQGWLVGRGFPRPPGAAGPPPGAA